jgi:hypothetical protein
MLESVLARTLNQALGWLVYDLDAADLRVGVFSGVVVLENLKVSLLMFP